ncbi:RNA-directed DNA polymerase, eukaryota [Tanacetum coccineum]
MASNPENVRLTVLMKLQEALDEEAILEEQMLALMHRFADRFTDRRVEINNLMVLHDHQLIDYGCVCCNGESLIMGDFNEVRCIEERWGSVFNSHGANAFNSFISNSGLNDIQLEGFSFTWAHPSVTKMSKLDRYLHSRVGSVELMNPLGSEVFTYEFFVKVLGPCWVDILNSCEMVFDHGDFCYWMQLFVVVLIPQVLDLKVRLISSQIVQTDIPSPNR